QLFSIKPEPGRRSSSARKPDPFVLTFRDDGKGMTPLELHKMLSFGHCDKDQHVSVNGQVMPIGHYGNGFKSGSMRLGKDALVFTKSKKTQSVGLLSQTFLTETNAAEVLVPIVSWDNDTGEAISVGYYGKSLNITPISTSPQLTEAFKANVKVINKYSPYESTAALRVALDKIQSGLGLKHDIQLAKCMWDEVTVAAGHTLAPLYYSLREYTSILYLNPRMQIWIRGHKVQLRKLEHCLYEPRECTYKSKAADGMAEPVTVTLGFNKFSDKEHFGMMIYHRDRLIKCFLHVGYQLSPDSRGVGVIGVLNVNALQPTHNKQSFIMDNNYRLLVNNLKDQLAKYWSTVTSKGTLTEFWHKLSKAKSRGKICIQCTKCMKWRSVNKGEIPELRLPKIEKLIKRNAAADLGDVEKKLEEQVIKIEKRHKDTLTKLRAVKAKELATMTGFPVEKCTAALRVSADNKEIAGQLLFSNKPIPGFDFELYAVVYIRNLI
ncbi:UBA/TSN domain containing protein, partial [Acanthamoeba castellanii str. Neff]